MSQPSEFTHSFADLGEATIHYVTAGADPRTSPPVVLLHGWPETWYEWRHAMPAIAERHPVIAPDLRGLGDSSRPAGGYDKRTVSEDIFRLLSEHLGLERWHLVGHDWGGPTAFALAAAASRGRAQPGGHRRGDPRRRRGFLAGRAALASCLPPYAGPARGAGRRAASAPISAGSTGAYSARPDAIDEEAVEEYLRTYSQPEALRAGFAFYRNLPRDIADNEALLATGFRLPMPVLAIGGGKTGSFGRAGEVEASMRRVATDVRGLIAEESGHFVPEEEPEFTARAILDHVAGCE